MDSNSTNKEVVLNLTLSATPAVLRALTLFVKRTRWQHFTDCRIDLDEARLMRAGIIELELALEEQGWVPR